MLKKRREKFMSSLKENRTYGLLEQYLSYLILVKGRSPLTAEFKGGFSMNNQGNNNNQLQQFHSAEFGCLDILMADVKPYDCHLHLLITTMRGGIHICYVKPPRITS
jgi:hypothetical protein